MGRAGLRSRPYPGRLAPYHGSRAAGIGNRLAWHALPARAGGDLGRPKGLETMAKHYRAPAHWQLEATGPALRYIIRDANGEPLAMTYGQPTQRRDAALMAEGPALLEMLQDAAQWIARGVNDGAYAKCVLPLAPARWLDRYAEISARLDPSAPTAQPMDAAAMAAGPEALQILRVLMSYVGGWDAPADHPCGIAAAFLARFDPPTPTAEPAAHTDGEA